MTDDRSASKAPVAPAPPRRPERRVSGRLIVWVGLALVLLISAYVMVRIVQVSGPGPDPSTIPKRPGT